MRVAVLMLTYFLMYQLDPSTTDMDLLRYLKTIFSEVTCNNSSHDIQTGMLL